MLVLLSFVMVLVATVLLVLGLLVSDGINLIYVSIGMSAVAAVLLVIAVRMSKPTGAAPAGPAPLEPEPEAERELVGVGASPARATAAASGPAPAAVSASDDWLASGDDWGSGGDAEFPIADYDDLSVDEVLGLLPQLYSDELDVVEARERRGLNRTTVIDRLAELRRTGTEADRASGDEAAETDGGWESGGLPIAGYDALAVSEIIGSLGGLNDAELSQVRSHETGGKNRRTIIAAIDRRLGSAPSRRTTSRAAAPARKAPAKKAPARKAAPAKKAPARSAPARKAAPAKKAAAPARKGAAPARKAAPAKKAAAPARKAAPAKKAPAKKAAAPAKKAAKKR